MSAEDSEYSPTLTRRPLRESAGVVGRATRRGVPPTFNQPETGYSSSREVRSHFSPDRFPPAGVPTETKNDEDFPVEKLETWSTGKVNQKVGSLDTTNEGKMRLRNRLVGGDANRDAEESKTANKRSSIKARDHGAGDKEPKPEVSSEEWKQDSGDDDDTDAMDCSPEGYEHEQEKTPQGSLLKSNQQPDDISQSQNPDFPKLPMTTLKFTSQSHKIKGDYGRSFSESTYTSQTSTDFHTPGYYDSSSPARTYTSETSTRSRGPIKLSDGLDTRAKYLRSEIQVRNAAPKAYSWLSYKSCFLFLILLVSGSIAFYTYSHWDLSRPAEGNQALKAFLGNFSQLQSQYDSQDQLLWKRTEITLAKHIKANSCSEPAIILFASAVDAKKTLQCLSRRIANVYSSSLDAMTAEVDGSNKNKLSSDVVKLEVDDYLNSEFSRGSKAAVVHRFDEFPPPSTLIFYKYCDHENAAYKDVALFFTVLLEEEEELEKGIEPRSVDEKVRDFLKAKFSILSDAASFDHMDTDKFSGLWSRISHVVLPIRPEDEIEQRGCSPE
ncbi:torsin-1A-interacting protein 2 isoform X2 [Latimeria chalumnae]|uniref:torsin-1A-interacting protein 2 isoform X2 n=1 Tax=Latimeria chalumnae TaxID=7897 RepID=UPI0003C19537|nr:PREDICTED: torsin-1A-interacting protein 2-like isoform X2 [Latimeria chalumnae]|eukprot:XP_006009058.1 PREDICTED: torsin-1A-interacting protein 2-like isoform X2 [Latimeria chalumnae]